MKQKTKNNSTPKYIETNKRVENIVDTLKQNYMPYAMSVIVSRAIPEIDGFKPSHRKLLYTMYRMNLLNANRTKSANIVGQTMKLNPHGDAAIYETMVKLSRGNESLLHAYIDSKGNFGKSTSRDMQFAAPRYTEAKLMPLCKELFGEIENDTVDFVDNYDSTMKEPVLLPTTFPNILVKSNKGIAVGMASSIPSFNLSEICNYTISYLKDQNCNMFDYILGPDFPSGGELLFDQDEMSSIYETGRGSFKLRGKYRYLRKEQLIEIYEIPYTTTVEVIIEKIIELIKDGTLKEITDIRDETDLNGLKITIDVRKNTDIEAMMGKIFKYTTLEDSFSCNFNILIDNKPKILGIKEIIFHWLNFRRQCILRKTLNEVEDKSKKLFLLQGLEKIILDIDKAISIIRKTEKEIDVLPNLMNAFSIEEKQAEYILEIKLRNLNKEYILKRVRDIKELETSITKLEEIYHSQKLQDKLIISELKNIIKIYGQERKTTIVSKKDIVVYSKEDFTEDYSVTMFLTKEGYLKKIPEFSLRAYSEQKLKENDVILQQMEMNNTDIFMLLSTNNVLYQVKVSELKDTKASLLGLFLPNYLKMDENEKIVQMIFPDKYDGYLVYFFENGKVAKINFSSYQTKSFRKKLQNVYSTLSPLVDCFHIKNDETFVMFTDNDRCLCINTSSIPEKVSRTSQGVKVIQLTKNTKVERIELLESDDREWDFCKAKTIPASAKKNKRITTISFL